MAKNFEDYLREAEKHYQKVMVAGCNGCKGDCELAKMGFDDNFVITTPLDCVELYQGLLKTREFIPNKYPDSFRGQYHLVHVIGCTSVAMATTGEEWDFARSVGYQTDMVMGALSTEKAIGHGLHIEPLLYSKEDDFLCEVKSVFQAVNGIFRFAKDNRVPLIGGFMKFGGFPRGKPRPYESPKLVYNPDKK